MKLLDRLRQITGDGADPGHGFDADRTIRDLEADDCVISDVAGTLELGGPEDAREKWKPAIDHHADELRRALGTVPGFRRVNTPPLGERWVVTADDTAGGVRLRLVERVPDPGPVIAEYETATDAEGTVTLRQTWPKR